MMTVSTTTSSVGPYSCNGSTTQFPVTFPFLENDDLVVYLIDSNGDSTTLTIDTDYTVTGAGGASGTVTTVATYASGNTILIDRVVDLLQETDLENQATYYPEVLEDALDKLTMIAQQLYSGVSRSIKFPTSDLPITDPVLPSRDERLGKFLQFDAVTGQPIVTTQTISVADYTGMAFETVSALRLSDPDSLVEGQMAVVAGYYAACDGGGGPLRVWQTSGAPYTDNGGSIIVPIGGDGSGAWVWEWSGPVNVKWFGVTESSLDNTDAYTSIINSVDEYTSIFWPTGTYVGNFNSSKSFSLDFNGSTISPSPANNIDSPVYFYGSRTAITTLSANALYGDNFFSVVNSSGIVAGDLLQIVDGKIRPGDSTPGINTELVRVKSVVANNVYVDDKIRSIQDTGTITVYKITSIISPQVFNVNVDMGVANTAPAIYLDYCEFPRTKNIEVTNNAGDAISFRSCYGVIAVDSRPIKPRAVGSGQGYGVVAMNSRIVRIYDVMADMTRHPVDFSSAYDVEAYNIVDMNGQSSGLVTLAHNTFGGLIKVDGVKVKNDGYAVVWSSQGVSVEADYIARDVVVRNVEHTLPTKKTNEFMVTVFMQTAVANVLIENVNVEYVDTSATPTSSSSTVRLNGLQNGNLVIRNISANEVGCLVFQRIGSFLAPNTLDMLVVENIRSNKCYAPVYVSGGRNLSVNGIFCPVVGYDSAILAEKNGTYSPDKIIIGDNISTDSTKTILKKVGYTTAVYGKLPFMVSSNSPLSLAASGVISDVDVQTRGSSLFVYSSGSGDITLNAVNTIAPPVIEGQQLFLVHPSDSRGAVIIPAASDTVLTGGADITIAKMKTYRFVGYGGKWIPQG